MEAAFSYSIGDDEGRKKLGVNLYPTFSLHNHRYYGSFCNDSLYSLSDIFPPCPLPYSSHFDQQNVKPCVLLAIRVTWNFSLPSYYAILMDALLRSPVGVCAVFWFHSLVFLTTAVSEALVYSGKSQRPFRGAKEVLWMPSMLELSDSVLKECKLALARSARPVIPPELGHRFISILAPIFWNKEQRKCAPCKPLHQGL